MPVTYRPDWGTARGFCAGTVLSGHRPGEPGSGVSGIPFVSSIEQTYPLGGGLPGSSLALARVEWGFSPGNQMYREQLCCIAFRRPYCIPWIFLHGIRGAEGLASKKKNG